MAGQALISGQMTGTPLGTVNIGPFTIAANVGGHLQATSVTLASGNNTITVPSWAKGMIIEPDPTNAVALTLKGIAADTGIPLGLNVPALITFPASPPATFVLNAASLFTTITTITFF
jgi:hypothetical protein